MDQTQNTGNIFNKYAEGYMENYMDVSLYATHLEYFSKQVKASKPKVLDLGCGPGNISRFLLKLKPDTQLMGVDIAPEMLKLARANNPSARFENLDCRSIHRLDQNFDAVVCGFCLPYLSRQETEKLIVNSAKLLQAGGLFYLSTIEGPYEKSGFKFSANAYGDKLFTYYHEKDYLHELLRSFKFEILRSELISNPGNDPGEQDLIIIARFSS